MITFKNPTLIIDVYRLVAPYVKLFHGRGLDATLRSPVTCQSRDTCYKDGSCGRARVPSSCQLRRWGSLSWLEKVYPKWRPCCVFLGESLRTMIFWLWWQCHLTHCGFFTIYRPWIPCRCKRSRLVPYTQTNLVALSTTTWSASSLARRCVHDRANGRLK